MPHGVLHANRKKCSMEFFRNLIFGELHILNEIWPYGLLHVNVIYLRYGVLQKYQVLRTPCPFVNFTAWSTPYVCIKYYLWSTPGRRLIFVAWSTPYDIFSLVPGVLHSAKMEWTLCPQQSQGSPEQWTQYSNQRTNA